MPPTVVATSRSTSERTSGSSDSTPRRKAATSSWLKCSPTWLGVETSALLNGWSLKRVDKDEKWYHPATSDAQSPPTITILPVALGDKDGQVFFRLNPNNYGGSHTVSKFTATAPLSEVPLRRLDSMVGFSADSSAAILFMKVDVEGAELRVLQGATTLLKQLNYLVVEVASSKPVLWLIKQGFVAFDAQTHESAIGLVKAYYRKVRRYVFTRKDGRTPVTTFFIYVLVFVILS